jgi:hypothetical protein
VSAVEGVRQSYSQPVSLESPTGLKIAHKGKIGRVLSMLPLSEGVTQHDCYPWHTRLSGSIKTLRDEGLEISTELEGEFRHARYRLHTPGTVTIHRDNTGAEQ